MPATYFDAPREPRVLDGCDADGSLWDEGSEIFGVRRQHFVAGGRKERQRGVNDIGRAARRQKMADPSSRFAVERLLVDAGQNPFKGDSIVRQARYHYEP